MIKVTVKDINGHIAHRAIPENATEVLFDYEGAIVKIAVLPCGLRVESFVQKVPLEPVVGAIKEVYQHDRCPEDCVGLLRTIIERVDKRMSTAKFVDLSLIIDEEIADAGVPDLECVRHYVRELMRIKYVKS